MRKSRAKHSWLIQLVCCADSCDSWSTAVTVSFLKTSGITDFKSSSEIIPSPSKSKSRKVAFTWKGSVYQAGSAVAASHSE